MVFTNAYEDDDYAASYARLDFPGTYYLAFRDLPGIISHAVAGGRALDVGCGTGRSTRFVRMLRFDVVGIDISLEMVREARFIDPSGDYRCVPDGDLSQFGDGSFDLILSAFTFDNIPTKDAKLRLLTEMARVLKHGGRMVNVVSSPEIYVNEWASFSTKDFPENEQAQCGDFVKIIVTTLDDKRPVVDVLCSDERYREFYCQAGLDVVGVDRPLGKEEEPHEWVSESSISPWVIYALAKSRGEIAVLP